MSRATEPFQAIETDHLLSVGDTTDKARGASLVPKKHENRSGQRVVDQFPTAQIFKERLQIVPCSIQDAKEYVRQFHRHHIPPVSGLFAVACSEGDKLCGVAIVGRPVARKLQDTWTAEVTRVATDGTKNACSILYAACWRAARALGYRKLITYTLKSESGISLRAAGWITVGETEGRSWNVKTRPRVDKHPLGYKLKWSPVRTGLKSPLSIAAEHKVETCDSTESRQPK